MALAKGCEWRIHLSSNFDLKEWFTSTEDASRWKSKIFHELHFYLVGIYLCLYPNRMDHHPLDPMPKEKWGMLTRRAWCGLSTIPRDQYFHDCLKIVPVLVTETERNLATRPRLPIEGLQMLSRDVDLVLQKVKEYDSPRSGTLDTLLRFHQQLECMLGDGGT